MIELLSDVPQGVIGIRVSGRLGRDDFRRLEPSIEELLKDEEVRIVEVVDPDYEGMTPGGLAEDLKLGIGTVLPHHKSIKRIAFVTDNQWFVHLLHAMVWMIPGELRTFGLDQLDEAKDWAGS